MADNSVLQIGNSDDLQIKHDGSHTYISNTTGFLHIRSNSAIRLQKGDGEPLIYAIPDGEVQLYHNQVEKFRTESSGSRTTGRFEITQEFPNGAYVYHATVGGGSNIPTFPYFIGNSYRSKSI